MPLRRFTLINVFGFEVKLDPSWLILGFLVAWTLADQVLPGDLPGASATVLWLCGAAGAVGILVSIVFHELCHSLVARAHGIPMRGITLFIFGGVAEMEDEPSNARAEFLIAAVGPLSSFVLAGLLGGAGLLLTRASGAAPVVALLRWLAFTNLALAVFNLLPAFPLDGGRVLRAALWAWRGSLENATRTVSAIGVGFGTLLIVLGVVELVVHSFIQGIWLALIGLFLRSAAAAPYRQLVVRRVLAHHPVSQFMRADAVSVPRAVSVQELVEDYFYRHHFKMFPVLDGQRLVGSVTLDQVKGMPREERLTTTVGAIATPCTPENTLPPTADAMDALQVMTRTGATRLLVAEGTTLAGVLTMRDMLGFLSMKMELEGEG